MTDVDRPFGRLKALQFIRNEVGCHFDLDGLAVPGCEVQEFGEATADLVDALVCPSCGRWATLKVKGTDRHERRCADHAIRMTRTPKP